MTFKPLLSATIDIANDPQAFEKLNYPVLVSPKFDGVRCIIRGGVAVSRSLKPIPRPEVQETFGGFEHFDGELIVGEIDSDVYNRTQSYVMSKDVRPKEDLKFYVFDYADEDFATVPFRHRKDHLAVAVGKITCPQVCLVEQVAVFTAQELADFEAKCLSEGYEGVMVRGLDGAYKHGRSTNKDGILGKVKQFADDEATVFGFIEQMTNTNEKLRDELGHAKRSSAKDGMIPAETLGKFLVQFGDLKLEVPCGTMKHDERKRVWDNKQDYVGRILKFRHFPHGAQNLPRFPRFVGWRTADDM